MPLVTPMPITRGFRQLVDEANAQVKTYSVGDVRSRLDDPKIQLVDIRDGRELEREGTVPGCINAPRGMLEFWVDPDSPYHKPIFASGKRFLLYCASGWRSTLAADTLTRMGVPRVSHLDGGFTAWKKAGLPVTQVERK